MEQTNVESQVLQALTNSVVSASKEHLTSDIAMFDGSHKSDIQPWVETINKCAQMIGTSCFELPYHKHIRPGTALQLGIR